MPAGRPRLTNEELLKRGQYKPSRHGPMTREAIGDVDPPEKPAGLSDAASAHWDEVIGFGVAARTDGPMLRIMCDTYAMLLQLMAEQRVAAAKDRPALTKEVASVRDDWCAMAVLFGMTPRDRLVAPTGAGAKPKVAGRKPTALDLAGPPSANGHVEAEEVGSE